MIDSTIVMRGDQYIMVLKDETRHPPAKNLRLAYSTNVVGPWSPATDAFSPQEEWVEGPTVMKVGESWIVYFDAYRSHRYGAMQTTDFKNWEDTSNKITVPKGMRHGTAFAVSNDVVEKLLRQKP